MPDYPLSLGLEPIQFDGVKMIVENKLLDADVEFAGIFYATPDDYPEIGVMYIDGLTRQSRAVALGILKKMYDVLDYDFNTKRYPPREGACTASDFC
jgi:hypothetical protein